MGLLFTILFLAVFGGLFYFIPTIIAVSRKIEGAVGPILINIFFGWTLIGWVGALIWACVAETQLQAEIRRAAYANLVAQQQYLVPRLPLPPPPLAPKL